MDVGCCFLCYDLGVCAVRLWFVTLYYGFAGVMDLAVMHLGSYDLFVMIWGFCFALIVWDLFAIAYKF